MFLPTLYNIFRPIAMTHKNNVCALDKQLITTVTTVVHGNYAVRLLLLKNISGIIVLRQ